LDEEKSKHAAFAGEDGFDEPYLHSLLRLEKAINAVHLPGKNVINMI
jgi:hypothetical protein